MKKTVMITGATDGIGLETARRLVSEGHHVIVHGRSLQKVEQVKRLLGTDEGYVCDLSSMSNVANLVDEISEKRSRLDVLINNAGVFKSSSPRTPDGLDVRFAVNTLAPYILTRGLQPLLGASGRVINLSSAAQASVDLKALRGESRINDAGSAYAQSKLALTIWSRVMALFSGSGGPVIVAVNPGSLLATKMVRDAYGMEGNDIRIGADILVRAAISREFSDAGGRYFDNDRGIFASPHSDALNDGIADAVTAQIEQLTAQAVRGKLG